jgi:hypothetical protein
MVEKRRELLKLKSWDGRVKKGRNFVPAEDLRRPATDLI